MMPFGITLLILSFICYHFLGWKGLNIFGLERVNPFQHMKERIKSMISHCITGLERVNNNVSDSANSMVRR
jgi:amino acid permease